MGCGDFWKGSALATIAMTGLSFGALDAKAEMPLVAAFQQGKVLVDIRARYEGVDDDNFARNASAATVRARLGFETGYWNDLSALFEFDAVRGNKEFNSTRNGRTLHPAVNDPDVTELNRLQLTWAAPFDNKITVGRQRIILGNARFIGNVGWRQHEQTFDGISLTNIALPDTTFTYAYLTRVNRIFGSDTPVPNPVTGAPSIGHFKSHSHLVNAVYEGFPHLRFEGYAYLLDLEQAGTPASGTLAARSSTATFGGRIEGQYKFAGGIKTIFTAEYARQTDYADNPRDFGLNYWLAELGAGYKGLMVTGGYEVLEGNGAGTAATATTIGFATPLATLHLFNGWADVFLTTPAAGLEDFYVKASYTAEKVLWFAKVTPTIVYHDYKANNVNTSYGSEWNASLDLVLDKNVSFNLKYADYSGDGGFRDKSIFWASTTYKF